MSIDLFINVTLILAVDVVIFYLVYLLVGFLRMRKSKESFASLHEALKVGQNVMLNSGIYGKIKTLNEEMVTLEIADKTMIQVSRFSIHSVLEK